MLKDKALKNVQACLASCDELIHGRFIFAENIISRILQDISESREIYELIAECMKNFNFDKEFNRARVKLPTKDGYFIMPESRAIVLPLVFCILVDIRDRKINFQDFLKNYFMSEQIDEFENFAQTLIVPFKNALAYCFELDGESSIKQSNEEVKEEDIELQDVDIQKQEDTQDVEQKQTQEKQSQERFINQNVKNFFKDVIVLGNEIKSELATDRRCKEDLRDDINYLVNTMVDCAECYDLSNVSADIVAISYIAKPVKCLRFLAQELRVKLTELYL